MTILIPNEVVLDWPLTCIYCGSSEVYYSNYADDSKCQVCDRWQLNEEEE